MKYLSIKNFDKHQHYKDRRPPWIKLHTEVLDDYEFLCLQDASKAHLMLLWVVASKMENRIPYDLPFLSRRIGATTALDLEELILQGFIEVSKDDSKTLAPRKQSAMPETERETERETEAETATPSAAGTPAKRPRGKAKTPPAEPVPVPFKTEVNATYAAWVATLGSVDYGFLRKQLVPVLKAADPAITADRLVQGVAAFKDARDADKVAFRGKYTVPFFAGDLHNWMRLGAMPLVDDWGSATERGRMAGLDRVAA